MNFQNERQMNHAKIYTKHLDNSYEIARTMKYSPWRYLRENFILTDHFIERCNERTIFPGQIVLTIETGKKYWTFKGPEENLVTKYIPKNLMIITKHCQDRYNPLEEIVILMSAYRFKNSAKPYYESESFVFEE